MTNVFQIIMASLVSYCVACLSGGLSLKFGFFNFNNFSYIHPGHKGRFVFFPLFFLFVFFTQTKLFPQVDVSDQRWNVIWTLVTCHQVFQNSSQVGCCFDRWIVFLDESFEAMLRWARYEMRYILKVVSEFIRAT